MDLESLLICVQVLLKTDQHGVDTGFCAGCRYQLNPLYVLITVVAYMMKDRIKEWGKRYLQPVCIKFGFEFPDRIVKVLCQPCSAADASSTAPHINAGLSLQRCVHSQSYLLFRCLFKPKASLKQAEQVGQNFSYISLLSRERLGFCLGAPVRARQGKDAGEMACLLCSQAVSNAGRNRRNLLLASWFVWQVCVRFCAS